VDRTYRRTIKLFLISYMPFFLIMVLLGRTIIRFWTNEPSAVPTLTLLLACNLLGLAKAWLTVTKMLLSGLNRLSGQAVFGIVLGVAGLAGAYALALRVGIAGLVWIVAIIAGVMQSAILTFEARWAISKRKVCATFNETLAN
jgi:hypothetical protein